MKENHLRMIKKFLCVVVILLLSPYMLYKGLYVYGVAKLPEDRTPIYDESIPEQILQLEWLAYHGKGPRKMTPIRFDHYLRLLSAKNLQDISEAFPPSSGVSSKASRLLIRRFQPQKIKGSGAWHFYWACAMIWVSKHWEIDDALSTIVHTNYYGHDIRGIEQAAQVYFHKSMHALTLEEAAVLVATSMKNGYSDPWCHSERNLKFSNKILNALDASLTMQTLPSSLAAPPEHLDCQR